MMTVGEALIRLLEISGVEVVFGIPGIHTIELYRGLDGSTIRHVTPRHEQGAAFMADGYARVTGKPGVCLLITGPGFTNAMTAIAQARADSVPMLVISGVNARARLGKGLGCLHELPDQAAMSRTVCLKTFTLLEPERLGEVVAEAFEVMTAGRPGPVHIEIPTDVMRMRIDVPSLPRNAERARLDLTRIDEAAAICRTARLPLILAGGRYQGCGGAAQARGQTRCAGGQHHQCPRADGRPSPEPAGEPEPRGYPRADRRGGSAAGARHRVRGDRLRLFRDRPMFPPMAA